MEKYFSFNEKALKLFGINLDNDGTKIDKLLRAFNFAIVFLSTFQNLMSVAMTPKWNDQVSGAVAVGLYDLIGCFKLYAVLTNLTKLRKIKGKLCELMEFFLRTQSEENFKELNRFRRITTLLVVSTVTCIWILNLLPLIIVGHIYLTEGVLVKILPFTFWYPFNKLNSYIPVYIYEAMCGHILTTNPMLMDGIIFFLIGQIIVLFKCVAESFVRTINKLEQSEKLSEIIDIHSKLYELVGELSQIYATSLLVNFVLQAVMICFIIFIISVSGNFAVE